MNGILDETSKICLELKQKNFDLVPLPKNISGLEIRCIARGTENQAVLAEAIVRNSDGSLEKYGKESVGHVDAGIIQRLRGYLYQLAKRIIDTPTHVVRLT